MTPGTRPTAGAVALQCDAAGRDLFGRYRGRPDYQVDKAPIRTRHGADIDDDRRLRAHCLALVLGRDVREPVDALERQGEGLRLGHHPRLDSEVLDEGRLLERAGARLTKVTRENVTAVMRFGRPPVRTAKIIADAAFRRRTGWPWPLVRGGSRSASSPLVIAEHRREHVGGEHRAGRGDELALVLLLEQRLAEPDALAVQRRPARCAGNPWRER